MRHSFLLAAAAAMTCAFGGASGWAQTNPDTGQIVKMLTPSSTNQTSRGIRVGPSGSSQPSGQRPASAAPGAGAAATSSAAPAVSLTVQFATGSADLTPVAIRTLNDLGRALTDPSLAGYRFRVEGHTDTVGSEAANKVLSERRAAAVVEYLAANFHIDRTRLEPVGMGEEGLLIATPPQTPEARNRRVQVVNLGN